MVFNTRCNVGFVFRGMDYDFSLFVFPFLKVFEIRNTEDLTEEWLREKLGFFH